MNEQAPIDGSGYLRAWQLVRVRLSLRAVVPRYSAAAEEWQAALAEFTAAEEAWRLIKARAEAEGSTNDEDDDDDHYGG